KLIQWADKNVKLVADAASNYKPDNNWIDWDDYVLQHMVGNIDYLSVHRYATEALAGDRSFSGMMSLGLDVDKKIDMVKALIEKAMMKSGSTRPVYISFDEWSGGGNSLTGSLMVAQHLNSFIRHADIVKMANMTMLSSLVGNSPDGDFKNALFQSFYLYSNNCHGTSLDVYANCEKYSNNTFKDIPYLDVTAVLNDSAKMLVVNVINKHETKDIPADIVLQTGDFTGSAKVNEVNGKAPTSSNTKTEEAVSINTREIKFKGNTINYSFPSHSFTQLEIPIK
ncbi:MAG: alpha-L-arabinofuranosidase C-terminal domain-containing protein, partial [Bacteroidales bacterium]